MGVSAGHAHCLIFANVPISSATIWMSSSTSSMMTFSSATICSSTDSGCPRALSIETVPLPGLVLLASCSCAARIARANGAKVVRLAPIATNFA